MNSLSYLSRQFDAIVASSSSSAASPSPNRPRSASSPGPSHNPPRRASLPSSLHPPRPSIRQSRRISATFRFLDTPAIPIPTPQSPTEQTPAGPFVPSSQSPMSPSTSQQIHPKSSPDLISQLAFVRVLFALWTLVRNAWRSLSRGRHFVPEPEIEVGSEPVTQEAVGSEGGVDLDDSSGEEGIVIQRKHMPDLWQRLEVQDLRSKLLPPPSTNGGNDPLIRMTVKESPTPMRLTPTPPPMSQQPTRPTPFHSQKTLVLDLDETLIHSTSRPFTNFSHSPSSLFGLKAFRRGSLCNSHTVEVVLGGKRTTYHVYKRPFVDYFLRKVRPGGRAGSIWLIVPRRSRPGTRS